MATTSDGCPYKGLQPYTEQDREYFFGRGGDTEIIASNLYIAPLTILYGTSGVGKSSVLQAGVIPHLRKNPRVIVLLFNNWQGDNFHAGLKEEILDAVAASTGESHEEVLAAVRKVNGEPAVIGLDRLPLDELLTGCAVAFRLRIMLIFDQFEEYFLYHIPTTGTEGFDAELARAVNQPESGVNFMIAMREEELSKLDRFRPRIPNLLSNLLRLENLDGEGATIAIKEPLRVYNERHPADQMNVEDSLVTAIIEQVRPRHVQAAAALPERKDTAAPQAAAPQAVVAQAVAPQAFVDRIETPFLQLVLTRLWETERKKRSHLLRLTTFEHLGGAQEIARTHLDKVMGKLTEAQVATAAAVLRFLVTPMGSKIALDSVTLASFANQDPDDVLAVLELLGSGGDMRILKKVTARNQPDRYELFHDVLGPAILDWRSRYMQGQQRIQERVKVEREFSQLRQKRLRQAVGVLAMLLVVMALTAVYAFSQRSEARRQYDEAKRQTDEAQRQRTEAVDQKNKADIARAEAVLAQIDSTLAKGDSDKQRDLAVSAQQTAEAEKKRADNQATLATNLVKISEANLAGFDAARLGDTQGSIDNFQKALTLSSKQNNTPGTVYALINIGDGYATRAVSIPREMFALFDAYDGDDYKDLMRESYQAESYFAGLEKALRERERGVLDDHAKAIEAYENAIRVDSGQKVPDLKKEASIQQRIGDVQLSLTIVTQALSSLHNDDDSEDSDKKPDLSPTLKSYAEASDKYNKAGLPYEEGVLQTRIAFIWSVVKEFEEKSDKDNQAAGENKMISAYNRALDAFHRAGRQHLEATTMVRLGKIYGEDLEKTEQNINKAISYYSQAAILYNDLSEREKEGESYSTSGDLYTNLRPPDREHAFEHYGKALTAFLAAASALSESSKQSQSGSFEEDQRESIEKQRDSLRKRGFVLISQIGRLYLQDPKPKAHLEEFFRGIITSQGNDYAGKAEILDVIAKMYVNDLKDIATGLDFYRDESQALKKAGDPLGQAKVLVTIGKLYNTLKDPANTKATFEEARAIYQHLPDKMDATARSQVISDLTTIAKIYTELAESHLALETYEQALVLNDEDSQLVQAAANLLTETDAPAFFAKLTAMYQKRNYTAGQALVLELAGERYALWGKFTEALDNYKRALEFRPTPTNQLARVGKLYYVKGDQAGAKAFFQKVVESYRNLKSSQAELTALTTIGDFYREVGSPRDAIDNYAEAARSSCKQSNYYGMTNPLRNLSLVFQSLGDTQEALRLSKFANDPRSISDCNFQIATGVTHQ